MNKFKWWILDNGYLSLVLIILVFTFGIFMAANRQVCFEEEKKI